MVFGYGSRSRDKYKSRFADINKFVWNEKGILIGKVRYKRKGGEKYVIPLTDAEKKEFSYKEV